MSDISHILIAQMELNNNNTNKEQSDLLQTAMEKRNSVSSASSTISDSSEDLEIFGIENKAKEYEGTTREDQRSIGPDLKVTRSSSDGQADKLVPQEYADIFPSLPDSVLNKLGLQSGTLQRERMTDEEVEQKFVTLALAFTIDSATIKDRCQRQRRCRDQTETNLNTEIDKLIQKVTSMQPMCVDARTAELLTGLLRQIDIVIRASCHAAIAAERFGAVQHEERLADAVHLMINHVSVLKQQTEAIRKQLEYTKKVLQDSNICEKPIAKEDALRLDRVITKRRASIATIVQPAEANDKLFGSSANGDIRKITRIPSDLSTRVSAFTRPARPSRLEFGADLHQINEDVVPNGVQKNQNNESDLHIQNSSTSNTNRPESTPSCQTATCYHKFISSVHNSYEATTRDGRLQEFFIFSALLCFVLGVVILGNMLVELELSKRRIQPDLLWKKLSSYFPKLFSR